MSERVITTEYTEVNNTPSEIDSTQEAPAYTGVRIFVGTNDSGQEVVYEAGDDTGSVLEIKNPFGTQAMANAVFSDISGYKYQPWSATRALLDPAAELGDGVSTSMVYGGMYRRVTNFGQMMATDIEAPYDAEEQHELGIFSPTERHFIRLESDLSSRIAINATSIEAKVSAEGGNQSFSWKLLSTGFVLKKGNTNIFEANASGITISGDAVVTGQINATSGYIGNSGYGFQINASSITNGKSSLTDNNDGVYIGTDGIALGANSAFQVTSSGAVAATNLTITGGSINIGNNAFQVTSSGAVTATDLSITGGSINIGNNAFQVTSSGAVSITGGSIGLGAFYDEHGAVQYKFNVDADGNLTARSGTFEGNVYAKKIVYGGTDSGYFDGEGIEPLTISGGGSYGQIDQDTIIDYNLGSGVNANINNGVAAYNTISTGGNIWVNEIFFHGHTLDDLYTVRDVNGQPIQVIGVPGTH